MNWLIDHALGLVGVVLGVGLVLVGEALGWSSGAVGLAALGVVALVSYLTVEEISRRDRRS